MIQWIPLIELIHSKNINICDREGSLERQNGETKAEAKESGANVELDLA